jgi:protein-L-isoaspartate(D-aspartate) O-methyltransferase
MREFFPYPQLEKEGITEKKVLQAVRSLPRELFVSAKFRSSAYENYPLPIACEQTISQPFIVAYMTEKLELKTTDKVLEIGTGSGFQTGVLAQLAQEVYTVEIHPQLSFQAQKILTQLGYKNIKYKVGDGKLGWPEMAPFDKIIVTATALKIPSLLVKQLKMGGKIILPLTVNLTTEYLVLGHKSTNNKIKYQMLIPVRFVSLV